MDTARNFPDVAVVVERARRASHLSAAEWDYALGHGGDGVELSNTIYTVATQGQPEGANRMTAFLTAQQHYRPSIAALAASCRERSYTGWSDAARARGERIRYAD